MLKARAVRIAESGGPEVLSLGEIDVRSPGPHEALVEIAAAGLNRADLLQRRGLYPAPPGTPKDVPGLEFAGTVREVGEGVREVAPGDRVMAIASGGAMATQIVVPARELMPVPAALTLEQAAAIPEVFLTAFDALVTQAGLGLGETLLIHAAVSGVGTAASQLGALMGATVIGTSRSAEKLEQCAARGLGQTILVENAQFADATRAIAPRGADVILDTVGAAYLEENVRALATRGRLVVVGLLGGTKGTLALGALLQKRARVVGTVLRSRPPEEKATLTQAFIRQVLPHFGAGRLRPVIGDVMPMSYVADAHRRMEADDTFGKIVLRWE